MDLNDKVVIVTGAGSGIGRALALEFARQGSHVVCVGRRIEPLQGSVAAIKEAGGHALALSVDITVQSEVEEMVVTIIDSLGHIDLLFNNAGSFNAIGAVWEVDPDLWWQDVAVNLRGTMLCTRAVLPHMIKQDSGIIINMAGGNQIPGGTGYSCSKIGVERFTGLLARELQQVGSSVMTFVMGPGFVRTAMTEIQIETAAGRRWLPSSGAAIDAGKDRPAEDCARATIKLVSVATPSLSGQTFGPDSDFDKILRESSNL